MKDCDLRTRAFDARVSLRQLTSSDPQLGFPPLDCIDPARAVTRGEMFGYLTQVAAIAARNSHVALIEQAPVVRIDWDKETRRFTITTDEGHVLKAQYLALSSGFVGTTAHNCRSLLELEDLEKSHPTRLVVLNDLNEISERNEAVRCVLSPSVGKESCQLVFPDALIGEPIIAEHLASQPPGTHIGVVGSGESAAKATVELALRCPQAVIDLFVKEKLLPSQAHTPNFNLGPGQDAVVQSIIDCELGAKTLQLMKDIYGTPVTPETLMKILTLVEQGRVRLFELGERFSGSKLDISLAEDGGIDIQLNASAQAITSALAAQREEFQSHGLQIPKEFASSKTLSRITGPLVLAVGYDRQSRLKSGIVAQLLEQGVLKLRDGTSEFALNRDNNMASATCSQLYPVGPVHLGGFGDSGFSGCGIRAYLAVQTISASIKGEVPLVKSLRSRPIEARASEASATKNRELQPELRFPGNPILIELAEKEKNNEKLSPVEKIVLARADILQEHIKPALRSAGFL